MNLVWPHIYSLSREAFTHDVYLTPTRVLVLMERVHVLVCVPAACAEFQALAPVPDIQGRCKGAGPVVTCHGITEDYAGSNRLFLHEAQALFVPRATAENECFGLGQVRTTQLSGCESRCLLTG